MGILGSCCFRTGYTIYAETRVGRCIHNKCLEHFRKRYGDNASHSAITPIVFNDLMVLPLAFLANNYSYMVADLKNQNFILVDVGDPDRFKDLPQAPDAILTTHKHWDHSAGNRQMRVLYPGLRVYGGVDDHVPDHTHTVRDGETVEFGRLKFKAIWTPGHTKGHIVWVLSGEPFSAPDSAFTGDQLMLACCGAPFEGSITTLLESMAKISQLPDDTMVWPGHELAVDGLELAVHIEPNNLAAILKLVWAIARRENMLCTCPSTLREEMAYNPFMRTKNKDFLEALRVEEYIKTIGPPKNQNEMDNIVFDFIMHRCAELRALKRKMKEAKGIEDRTQREDNQNPEHSKNSVKSERSATSHHGSFLSKYSDTSSFSDQWFLMEPMKK